MLMQRRLCVLGEKCRPSSFKGLLNCRVLHHDDPTITIEVVADHCGIKLSRLRKYVAESEPDQIPFLALLRIAAFLDAWDLVDFALQQYHRRTEALDAPTTPANTLNEAVDVTVAAAQLLQDVREAAPGGFDVRETTQIRERVRTLRRELDEVDASLDQVGAK